MAVSASYYLNAPALSSATSVFMDEAMSILAADGYYSNGVIVRQQVGGILLPQQLCLSYLPFGSSVSAVSSAACCALDETETYYSPTTFINLGDTIYTESCGTNPIAAGFYRASGSVVGGNDWFEVNSSGVVISMGPCGTAQFFSLSEGNPVGMGGTCDLPTTNALYSIAPSATGSLGYYMYTNTIMTEPFVGVDGDEYALILDSDPGTIVIVTISSTGQITFVSNCP